MNRSRRSAACFILIGLMIILATFRIATAPGFISMLVGAAATFGGMVWFSVDLILRD